MSCKVTSLNILKTYIQLEVGELGLGEVKALGDKDLELDEIKTSHQLGNRVLHLKTSVHLQEIELAGSIILQHHVR
jgi:hypothetical protein